MSLPRIISLIVIISVSVLVITGYYYDREEVKKLSIPKMYFMADNFENGGQVHYNKILDIYTKIIEIDRIERLHGMRKKEPEPPE